MELLGLLDLPIWIVVTVGLAVTLYIYTLWKQSIFRRLGVPGPKPAPFLGMLPVTIKKGMAIGDQEIVREHGRCFGVYMGNVPMLMVTDPEMIKQVFVKDFSKFTDRPNFFQQKTMKSLIASASGDYWRFLRSLMSPIFTSGKLKHVTPQIQSCVHDLVKNMAHYANKGEPFDTKEVFGSFTLDVSCLTGFGMEVGAQKDFNDPFVQTAKKAVVMDVNAIPVLLYFVFPDLNMIWQYLNPFNKAALKFMIDAIERAWKERQDNELETKDVLQMMMTAYREEAGERKETETKNMFKDRGLTAEEAKGNALTLLLAGYETTAVSLVWLSYCLASNQDCQDKLANEIQTELKQDQPSYSNISSLKYLDMVVSESLRLYPPGTRVMRTAMEDVQLGNYQIPKGMGIAVPTYALHRDPQIWPEPDKFDPERFFPENKQAINTSCYLPFGLGPRNCVGMRLAVLQMKLAIASVVQKYRLLPTADTQHPPEFDKGGILKPAKPIFLRVEERS